VSNHYFSINRGVEGTKPSDITQGAASTPTDDIELRLADGANLTRKDVVKAIKAFIRRMCEPSFTTFPPN
jgi:hypothetical protein